MGERWFLLAGEGEYGEGSGLARLEHVPHELSSMRRTLQDLGMREIRRPGPGERGLHQVCADLGKWLETVRSGEQEPPLSLFVYCTGHGEREGVNWGLALPTHTKSAKDLLPPQKIINTLYGSDDELRKTLFGQAVLVLDACYSESGAADAMGTLRSQAALGRVDYDAWVIATARRTQQAGQLAFARAFAKTLEHSPGTSQFIDPTVLVERVNGHLPTVEQEVWVYSAGRGSCRALPDPAYMPRTSPDWLDGLDEWSHLARGRSRPRQEGWYFSGRAEEQRRLRAFIAGGGPAGPLILRGAAGVGKSALLGHLAVCGKPEWRRRLPPVARRRSGGLILPDDSVHALVSAQDATVSGLARRIGRALGLGLEGTPTPDELCEALEALPPRTVLVDDLHLADGGPAALVTELLDPLAEYARTTVIASAGHDPAADRVWQDRQLPVFQLGTDDEGVRAYVDARLRHASTAGGGTPGTPSRRGVGAIAAACHGHFGAAVHAVDEFLRTPPHGDGAASARDAAGKRLRTFHLSLLAARDHSDVWCRAMLEPVRAAAECGHEAGLTAEHWAALATASDHSGGTYGPEDAREAAELLGDSVTNTAAVTGEGSGTGRGTRKGSGSGPAPQPPAWRLATPFAPRPSGSEFAEAVRECLPVHASEGAGIDWAADTALTALFGDVARHHRRDFAAELSSPAFWNALPAGALARQLRDGGRDALPDAVGAGVRTQKPGLHPAERAFQLKLSLLRAGEDGRDLDPRGSGAGVDILWATPKDEVAVPDLLAVAGAGGEGFVVTTHGDASVQLWNLADGAPLVEPVRSEEDGIATHMALAVVGGEPVVALVTDGAGLLWRPLSGEDPEPLAALDGATAISLHGDGLLAVARGARIEVVEWGATGRTRSFAVPGSSRVTQVHLGGPAGDVRLVATTEFGTVTARVQDTGVSAVRRQPLLMPATQHAVVSSTGRTVAMLDQGGGLFVWDESRGTRGLDLPAARDGAVALAVGDSLAAAAGDAKNPWLCVRPITPGDERPTPRLPLPDQPIALALDADGSRLVVADVRGVFCLDVSPDAPRPDPAEPDPPGPAPTRS
ncbi:ATP-binding protein [Streptomyces sp. NPDC001728]|uniref:ATP-binding protein n=1 Tax=Streptomyces sp. NPDC001728 TaxID=3154396 RepID=UPI003330033E